MKHAFVGQLPGGLRSLVLTEQEDDTLEGMRQALLSRRDAAIAACMLEIGVSVASMALYDVRRSILVPIVNTVLALLSAIGLHGAMTLSLRRIQVHGVVTTGLIIACLLNFLAEALLTHAGVGSDTLPGWLVLLLIMVPYSLNLACSLVSLLLSASLSEYLEVEESRSGLVSSDRIEQQAEELRGQDVCCVCMDQRKDAVLTPCGHRAVCVSCGDQLKVRGRRCPVCRQWIEGVVRVFDS